MTSRLVLIALVLLSACHPVVRPSVAAPARTPPSARCERAGSSSVLVIRTERLDLDRRYEAELASGHDLPASELLERDW